MPILVLCGKSCATIFRNEATENNSLKQFQTDFYNYILYRFIRDNKRKVFQRMKKRYDII